MDEPVSFKYEDTDSYQNEISDIYSYSEESEFFANRNAFEESMEDCGLPLNWKHMVEGQQQRAIAHLISTLEVSCRSTRIKSCRALAYLIQGNFGECLTIEEQEHNSKENVYLLYKHGIFQAFVHQLAIETAARRSREGSSETRGKNTHDYSSDMQIFNDSAELRLILAVLCTITETMYHIKESDDENLLGMRQQFIFEIQNPFENELLSVMLFQMLDQFCAGQAPHYPVRKVLLLLWKVILLTLGGSEELKKMKDKNRRKCNLAPIPDDTIEVTRNMAPCVPPMNQPNQSRSRPGPSGGNIVTNKRKVFKQSAFDDAVFAYAKFLELSELNKSDDIEQDKKASDDSDNGSKNNESDADTPSIESEKKDNEGESNPDTDSIDSGLVDRSDLINEASEISSTESESNQEKPDEKSPYPEFEFDLDDMTDRLAAPIFSNFNDQKSLSVKHPSSDGSRSDVSQSYRGLPWAPKVRKIELDQHLTQIRSKFLGYTLPNDLETTFGLPKPIVEGLNVLKKHLYVSLSEAQLEREDKLQRYPLTHQELNQDYHDEPAEKLYQALLPRLPQYMIALLKILLAASTSAKCKPDRVDSINIMAEINPDVSSQSVVHLMKMNTDSSRQEGILIKSISAILLLLLKHFKINHIYQFEYVSQQLMFANCIPLILKFLSQDIQYFVITARPGIPAVDFPACVIGEPPELTADAIELSSIQPFCWRNIFSCINLVRVLNKLTKWKHSRIMMLVVFKSSPTLLKALNVRQPMFQLYVLKLLKVQLKFLGRQWKKNNMRLISPIYQKVRHRLTDDWAYSNDNEARPWDFQAEEFTLQNNINKFHHRRYKHIIGPLRYKNQQISQTGSQSELDLGEFSGSIDLSEEERYDMFEQGKVVPYFSIAYEKWLENEVHQRHIDWDKLLQCC